MCCQICCDNKRETSNIDMTFSFILKCLFPFHEERLVYPLRDVNVTIFGSCLSQYIHAGMMYFC